MAKRLIADEFVLRRTASRRLACLLGVTALAIYLLGICFYRP